MSTKVQPANDTGNDGGEGFGGRGEDWPFSEKNRAAYLRRSEASRTEQLASSTNAPPRALEVQYESIPDTARGPWVLSAFSPVEDALNELACRAHSLVRELEGNPSLHEEIAKQIYSAARSLEIAQRLPVTSREQPTPRFVLDLFDAAIAAIERIVASEEHDESTAVSRVALAVATMRAGDEFCSTATAEFLRVVAGPRRSVDDCKRAAIANARAFERWFFVALSELRSMSASASLLARSEAMSDGFPGGEWPRANTIYKTMREVRAKALTPLESHCFAMLVDDIVDHSRSPELMGMWERDAPIGEALAYTAQGRR